MRKLWSLGRFLSKPGTLWCLFALGLMLTAAGLAVLSHHALRLSRQQQVSQQREQVQQNVRVALWRLDSRLGPYIATLHDADLSENLFSAGSDNFVIARFSIARAPGNRAAGSRAARSRAAGDPASQEFMMMPLSNESDLNSEGLVGDPGRAADDAPNPTDRSSDENWQRLVKAIPVESVVSAVEELIPEFEIDQSFVQAYGIQVPQSGDLSQRELVNRGAVVQQQLEFNTWYGTGKGGKGKAGKSVGTLGVAANEESIDEGNPTRLISAWIDEHLVVVRTGRAAEGELEGAWVDWPALRRSLLDDIEDLVPGADLLGIKQVDTIDPARTLAALPAMVVVPDGVVANRDWSPTHTALLFAWCALLVAAVIAAIALSRLIATSERRASFVSAVTHELRTPLTTFRLYSDLLARDMVSDPKDRKEYLETLRREADRLTHLVDNVLRYSKLQQTSKRAALESVMLSDWIERISPRLSARLDAVDMSLVVDQKGDGRWTTDPPAMEQVVFNLVDNAAKYAGTAIDRRVHFTAEIDPRSVRLTVADHGPGVPESLRSTIFRPFTKSAERAAETAAGVGLGLALARQTAIAHGGSLCYQPTKAGGASFQLSIPRDGDAKG